MIASFFFAIVFFFFYKLLILLHNSFKRTDSLKLFGSPSACSEAARVDEVWMRGDDTRRASNQRACSQDTAKLSLTAVAAGAARDRRSQSDVKNTDEY